MTLNPFKKIKKIDRLRVFAAGYILGAATMASPAIAAVICGALVLWLLTSDGT